MLEIYFSDPTRVHWIRDIIKARELEATATPGEEVVLKIASHITPTMLEPIHVASFACLVKLIIEHQKNVSICAGAESLDFLTNDLRLGEYFGEVKHVDAKSGTIFNLWKIESDQAIMYSDSLSKYFEREFFTGMDLSFFKVVLDELYANVADHSQSDGIAYSFIVLDEKKKILQIAFCDFGIGIPESLKRAGVISENSTGIILLATRNGISAKSNPHNAGYGLDTVISSTSDQPFRIVSNNELYYCQNNRKIEQVYPLNFYFKGTLVYFALDMNNLEEDDLMQTGIL